MPVLALWSGALALDGFRHWVATAPVPALITETSRQVKTEDGTLLRAYLTSDGYWRLPARADEVDKTYVAMLLAYEDKRFHGHGGVDLRALLRAAAQAALSGEIRSGGSTITMQVARLLIGGSTRSFAAKREQIRLALALEKRLTKREILDLYLQRAPFGGNIEGIAAACRAWLAKPCRRLSRAEAALLVALPQSPEARRPDHASAAAKAARDRVLHRAALAGVISPETHDRALSEPVPTRRHPFPKLAPHLSDRALAAFPGQGVVRIGIDARIQHGLEALARDRLTEHDGAVQIALLAVENDTGRILASVGSAGITGPHAGFVDLTQARRSPGSTLKPLVYGLAFDQGLAHPESLIDDRPRQFGTYAPQNFDGVFRGRLRVREALQLSLNTPVVSLTEQIGPARLLQAMKRAGMAPDLPGSTPGLALALGGVGVSLEELVSLYAGLANGGRATALTWAPGAVASPENRQFMGPLAAWYVADILRGMPSPIGSDKGEIAFKTGTSYGHRDAWAIGFDGAHTVGVWMGRPDGTPVPGAFGGDLAAPVLFEAFARLSARRTPLPPPPPEALTVGTAQLPQALRIAAGPEDASVPKLSIAFPPSGAELLPGAPIVAKLRHGTPPFTWLANGQPLPGTRQRETVLPLDGPGFHVVTAIDARGARAQVDFRLLAPD
ncbi:Penicillin-binding protein 1F [Pseudoruegeria aquimaris]|uniref:peptidoglycan glycosyltransferase n=2 Tax=Pseudoruegeria aquimaris TaxID=393663 RepID=A0A1Y5S039_9RHOB|nr:Penicillin-binding protein 1F [Pseudoruegeria aquimaris]